MTKTPRSIPNPRAASSSPRSLVTVRRLHKFVYTMNVMSRPDESVAARESGFGLQELGEPTIYRSKSSPYCIRVWPNVDCLASDWLIERDGLYAILPHPFAIPDGFEAS